MMNSDLKIENVHTDFSQYYQKNNISRAAQSKTDCTDFLALPTAYSDGSFYFAQETIDFIKYCRNNSSSYSFDVLADGDIQVRSFHSFDIWMPVIWVATSVLLPVAVNLVSNYIWEKLKGRENEPAQVDVTFLTKKGDEEKVLHYSGDAKTFKESFEKIDIGKM